MARRTTWMALATTGVAAIACSAPIQVRGPGAPVLVQVEPVDPIPTRDARPAADSIPPATDRPVVAILIDDLGESMEQVAPFLDVPGPLSFAILPTAAGPRDVAARLVALGRDVLAHVPMEPAEGDLVQTPGFLNTRMDDDVLRAVLARDLEAVPGARGANNHMGSRFTTDPERMDVVLRVLKARGLFFVDSRTTTASVGRAAAERAGLPEIDRDVFLDDEADRAGVDARLKELVTVAKARGCALGIGHPHAGTAAAIMRWARDPDRGADLVPLSRLLALPCRNGAAVDRPDPAARARPSDP